MNTRRANRGITLIELVVTITVVAIAVASVLGVLSSLALRSADAMIRDQAAAIASGYLDEVLQKSFVTGPGTGARANLDDINDYNGWNETGVSDQQGNAVAGLSQFNININVGPGTLGNVLPVDVQLVNVTVTHVTGLVVTMSGYRTRYP